MEDSSINKAGAFAQRLADDCRQLAATEQEGAIAGLYEKLARLFEEAAAVQRCQAARPHPSEDDFDLRF